jgi:hypothetical protein
MKTKMKTEKNPLDLRYVKKVRGQYIAVKRTGPVICRGMEVGTYPHDLTPGEMRMYKMIQNIRFPILDREDDESAKDFMVALERLANKMNATIVHSAFPPELN